MSREHRESLEESKKLEGELREPLLEKAHTIEE